MAGFNSRPGSIQVGAQRQIPEDFPHKTTELSGVEADGFTRRPASFFLRDQIGEVVYAQAHSAYVKGLELAYRVWPDVPDSLLGDPDRFRLVLGSLVDNAVKFTEEGEVLIRATVESKTDEKVCIRFEVADTGPGIPPENINRIFGPEAQNGETDENADRSLVVSARSVEQMGGRISVESDVGEGSTFQFTACFGFDREAKATDADSKADIISNLNKVLDRESLLDRIDNNLELLGDIVRMFNESLARHFSQIEEAISRNDSQALRTSAHSLKGVVAHFSAPLSYQIVYSLERMGIENDLARAGETFKVLKKEIERLSEALTGLIEETAAG